MRYAVVLDPSTVIGAEFLMGNHDGVTSAGNPLIDCVSLEHGHMLSVTRELKNPAGLRQQMLLPYGAVAAVICYAVEDRPSVGFGLRP